jgi:acyl-coenzyme A thioesterase PaaI-like protein
MSLARWLQRVEFFPEHRRLEMYPPFLFMGAKVVSVASDYRKLHVRIPLRWYFKNMHGSMFGGFIAAISDPLPALLCSKIFPGLQVWTKKMSVEFLKPARTGLDLYLQLPETSIDTIAKDLQAFGRSEHEFSFDLTDARRRIVASVKNTVFMCRKDPGNAADKPKN